MQQQRVTARIRILTAFRDLEKGLGRQAFSLAEIAGRVPENARGTVGNHLASFMADGKSHGKGYGEVERVGRSLYQLTARGRGVQRDLGLLL
ncbi:hypothetical protein [Deinococcus budaensis]|uniref:Transcriptional regulator n=1 Tax=Deinococcus budaensis TaxID=1665626 RepID=A0A7W8LQK5_9DEIO|nr:hypothetical protein [Deinococcus budaensis]MBB5234963.1 hypothetical protein [Deinococcus budaensis]